MTLHRRSQRSIFLFWAPLAAQWLMMATEGPFLAAMIARLPDPKFNLAAYGVSFAFAILVEAPVIMLMSASTAMAEDRVSYRRLRNFTRVLNAGVTALMLVILIPSVHHWVMQDLVGLPDEVASLTYGALWLLLPWPAAIGYRRFLHGLLIRSGRTKRVAQGTAIRLTSMTVTAVVLFTTTSLPGAWVGGAALSLGVVAEALAAHLMARRAVRELRNTPEDPDSGGAPSYGDIARFYYPLALTSIIGLATLPMLTFFMGRAPDPVESLAVFPVVHALSFIFRAFGLSFLEVSIALLGREYEHLPEMTRFATVLGASASVAFGIVAFTPLATVWFETVSGLTPDLSVFALLPTRILVPFPALTVLLSFQRAILMLDKRTRPITGAVIIEVAGIATLFLVCGWGLGMVGVTAAFLAAMCGRIAGVSYLAWPTRQVLKSRASGGSR